MGHFILAVTYQSGKVPFFSHFYCGNWEFHKLTLFATTVWLYHYCIYFTLQRILVYYSLIEMHTRKMMDILSNTHHCLDLYSGREWTRNWSWRKKDKDRTKANPWPPPWQDEIIVLSTRKALQMNNKLSAFPPWSHLGILKYLTLRRRHQRMLIRKCDSWWII